MIQANYHRNDYSSHGGHVFPNCHRNPALNSLLTDHRDSNFKPRYRSSKKERDIRKRSGKKVRYIYILFLKKRNAFVRSANGLQRAMRCGGTTDGALSLQPLTAESSRFN